MPAETHVRQNVNRDLSTSTENVRNVLDHVQKVRHINIIILLNLIYSVIIFFSCLSILQYSSDLCLEPLYPEVSGI